MVESVGSSSTKSCAAYSSGRRLGSKTESMSWMASSAASWTSTWESDSLSFSLSSDSVATSSPRTLFRALVSESRRLVRGLRRSPISLYRSLMPCKTFSRVTNWTGERGTSASTAFKLSYSHFFDVRSPYISAEI